MKSKHRKCVQKKKPTQICIFGFAKNGVAGYRSPYLSHAKRALYHVSYDPLEKGMIQLIH